MLAVGKWGHTVKRTTKDGDRRPHGKRAGEI